ncbi:MAG: hypothetical protein ACRCZE_02580 [Candidatus Altimarinota bacterium]
MSKNLSQIAAAGVLGLGAYAYYDTVGTFEEDTEKKVLEYQSAHQTNLQLEHQLESQTPYKLAEECRQELRQCLKSMPLSEICQNSLTIPAQEFYNLYGYKGINENFSYPATVCYSQIAESVDQCEKEEIACLRAKTTANLRAVYTGK